MKGWALGLNAAGGNIGVSSVQLLTPILMGVGLINLYQATPVSGGLYLQNAGLMWLLPLVIAVIGAVLFMNNLTSARSTFKDQLAIIKRKHTWIMSFIYIGTFGSFIGYSAAFPLLIKTQFPSVTIAIAFLGPLVGSLSRPLGGLLADKVGGAIVTFWNFIAMGAATIGVMYFVGIKDFAGFLAMFLILFVTTGIGKQPASKAAPHSALSARSAPAGAISSHAASVPRLRPPAVHSWLSEFTLRSTRPVSRLRGGTTCGRVIRQPPQASPRRACETGVNSLVHGLRQSAARDGQVSVPRNRESRTPCRHLGGPQ